MFLGLVGHVGLFGHVRRDIHAYATRQARDRLSRKHATLQRALIKVPDFIFFFCGRIKTARWEAGCIGFSDLGLKYD